MYLSVNVRITIIWWSINYSNVHSPSNLSLNLSLIHLRLLYSTGMILTSMTTSHCIVKICLKIFINVPVFS
jgi:hypothetical protein